MLIRYSINLLSNLCDFYFLCEIVEVFLSRDFYTIIRLQDICR